MKAFKKLILIVMALMLLTGCLATGQAAAGRWAAPYLVMIEMPNGQSGGQFAVPAATVNGKTYFLMESGMVDMIMIEYGIGSADQMTYSLEGFGNTQLSGSIPMQVEVFDTDVPLMLLSVNREITPLAIAETISGSLVYYDLIDEETNTFDYISVSASGGTQTDFELAGQITMGGGPVFDQSGLLVGMVNEYDHCCYAAAEFLSACGLEYSTQPYASERSYGIEDIINEYWYWLAAGAGVIIVLVVVIIVRKGAKRKNKAASEVREEPVAEAPVWNNPAPTPAYDVRCTGGTLQGNAYRVTGRICLGRNYKECEIVYPTDERGVSGMHLSLEAGQDGVILTDLGSTYGTYVNGAKISPNAPVTLQVGDRFTVAIETNEFVVAAKA